MLTNLLTTLVSPSPPAPSSTSIDLAIWKWVIFIGVAAVIVFYAIKRISEIVVARKTDAMIRDVVGEESDNNGDE